MQAGRHVVCSRMTEEFLAFTKARGNDLSSPAPRYGFPGLRPGDFWCLCASRWREAMQAGVAPPVVLESTHRGALDYVTLGTLQQRRWQGWWWQHPNVEKDSQHDGLASWWRQGQRR